jgi:mRNA interferase RelE/StbE
MKRKIHLSANAEKSLAKVEKSTRKRLINEINNLTEVPPLGDIKPLKGTRKSYRARVGKYRILFELDGDTVRISSIDSRGGIYKGGF